VDVSSGESFYRTVCLEVLVALLICVVEQATFDSSSNRCNESIGQGLDIEIMDP